MALAFIDSRPTSLSPAAMAPDLLVRARQASASDRLEEAEDLFNQALARSAGDVEARCDLAAVQFRLGHFVDAARSAGAVLEARDDHDDSRFVLALALDRLGNQPRASQLLHEITQGARGQALARRDPALARAAGEQRDRIDAYLQSLVVASDPSRIDAAGDDASVRWTGRGPAKYDFSHLDQPAHQRVVGPIQDDEALLLYAVVRVMRIRRVLEVGGLGGYSARNFLAAMQGDDRVAMYTIDIHPVPSLAPNHFTIQRDCSLLEAADVHGRALDLVFFDAHVADAQLRLLDRLESQQLVHANTVIALHDTGLHPRKGLWGHAVQDAAGREGFVHQAAEREMVNALHARGWDALDFHMDLDRSDIRLPVRHGLTLMRRFRPLAV